MSPDASALKRALDMLASIRYQTWPVEGMGVGLTAESIDAILIDGEAEVKANRRHENKANEKAAHLAFLGDAAIKTWDAYLDWGPVDDGRPEGDAFESALDALMMAFTAAGRRSKRKKKGTG